MFFLNGDAVTNWQLQNKWTWQTTDDNVGKNEIKVWIRDGKNADRNSFDDSETADFEIAAFDQKTTISKLSKELISPQEVGEKIRRTDNGASVPPENPISYRFVSYRDHKLHTAPDLPTIADRVYLTLESIPSGNIKKYQWSTDNDGLDYIGEDNRTISYIFKTDITHRITVNVFLDGVENQSHTSVNCRYYHNHKDIY